MGPTSPFILCEEKLMKVVQRTKDKWNVYISVYQKMSESDIIEELPNYDSP